MDVIAAVVVVTMIVSNGVTRGNAVIYPGLGLRKNIRDEKERQTATSWFCVALTSDLK